MKGARAVPFAVDNMENMALNGTIGSRPIYLFAFLLDWFSMSNSLSTVLIITDMVKNVK